MYCQWLLLYHKGEAEELHKDHMTYKVNNIYYMALKETLASSTAGYKMQTLKLSV